MDTPQASLVGAVLVIDILYLAWNRKAFTEFSFDMLCRNTDWERVHRLYVYDDDSEDGTGEWLWNRLQDDPPPVSWAFKTTNYRSPVATMNDYLSRIPVGMFAKIDNDIVVPPTWLDEMLSVMDRNPTLDVLGMEAGRTRPPEEHPGWSGMYGWTQTSHIGGVGLIRTKIFEHALPTPNGFFGWTEFQAEHKPRRGWITPDLLVCSLDMVPAEPWTSLSRDYKAKGWQRGWASYDVTWPRWWAWWENPGSEEAVA